MKIGRFLVDGKVETGMVEGDVAVIAGREMKLENLVFLPQSVPKKIVCVGLNYKDHAAELGMELPAEPVIFLKPTSALNSHKGNIVLPPQSKRVDYEGELAFVIGKKGKNIKREDASQYISGLTCLNDVTARDIQERDVQWTRAKGFDTFAPAGPWISTLDEFKNLEELDIRITLRKNGETMQDSTTKNLIFHIPEIVEFISGIMTLEPGDIVSTGSPPGNGHLKNGDVVELSIEGIGTLKNYVKKA